MGYTIWPDGKYGDATQAAYEELMRAKEKFPAQFVNGHEGYAVILEEVDEMWDDIKNDRRELSVKEAIQVAAMAIRYVAELGEYPYVNPKPQPQQKEQFSREDLRLFTEWFDDTEYTFDSANGKWYISTPYPNDYEEVSFETILTEYLNSKTKPI